MARIRTIKPEFPQSETVGRLSRDARLLFVQLWTICDDHGRCRATPKVLAGVLYPYDDDARDLIDGWLSELQAEDCIRLYRVDGSTYLEVVGWSKHQRIDNAGKPICPVPTDADFVNKVEKQSATVEKSTLREPPRTAASLREPPLDLGPRTKDLGVRPSADADASSAKVSETQVVDLKAEIFGQCLQWLAKQSGKDPQKLRPLVGRWIRDHGEAGVLQAFIRAQREGPVEPIAWMTGSLTGMGARKSAIEEGLTKWLREKGSHDVSEFSEGDGEIVRGLPVPQAGTG